MDEIEAKLDAVGDIINDTIMAHELTFMETIYVLDRLKFNLHCLQTETEEEEEDDA